MPIYEYVCQECDEKYDKFVRSVSSNVTLKCPNCGSDRGEKAFSIFSSGGASTLFGGESFAGTPACGPVG